MVNNKNWKIRIKIKIVIKKERNIEIKWCEKI